MTWDGPRKTLPAPQGAGPESPLTVASVLKHFGASECG
jgi:hypothetical protein